MDIISYGIANKAGSAEKKTRNQTLAVGVQGKYPHTKARIDAIERAFEGLTLKANKLIVNDTVNIMKAHAKLNAITNTNRYKMKDMIFDDLLDLSGIDLGKSYGFTHNALLGTIQANEGSVIETIEEVTDVPPSKVVLVAEEGKTSGGIKFSGSGGKLNLGKKSQYNLSTASGVTFECWINPSATNGHIIGNWEVAGGGIILTGGKVRFELYLSRAYRTVTSDSPVPLNEWTHVAGTYDKETMKLYVNGELQSQTYNSTANMTNSSAEMGVGYNPPSGNSFLGIIDELRLWRRAKSQEEIQRDMNTYPSNTDELALYLSFDDGLVDLSPYENNSMVMSGGASIKKEGYDMPVSNIQGKYSISRDNGTTWESIEPDTLFYFNNAISPLDNKLRLKAELPSGTKLLNYALTWA